MNGKATSLAAATMVLLGAWMAVASPSVAALPDPCDPDDDLEECLGGCTGVGIPIMVDDQIDVIGVRDSGFYERLEDHIIGYFYFWGTVPDESYADGQGWKYYLTGHHETATCLDEPRKICVDAESLVPVVPAPPWFIDPLDPLSEEASLPNWIQILEEIAEILTLQDSDCKP